MNLATITIFTIEMTRAEYEENWEFPWRITVAGKKVLDWDQDDGDNQILLEGETSYRAVVITDRK